MGARLGVSRGSLLSEPGASRRGPDRACETLSRARPDVVSAHRLLLVLPTSLSCWITPELVFGFRKDCRSCFHGRDSGGDFSDKDQGDVGIASSQVAV